jgi:DNA-binding transcriptional ArsR family regulator
MDLDLSRALSHPVRWEIVEALQERVASPVELSEQIGESQRVVSYHAGALVRCGCLELVHSRGRRGGIENFFAITPHCDFKRNS